MLGKKRDVDDGEVVEFLIRKARDREACGAREKALLFRRAALALSAEHEEIRFLFRQTVR